MFNSVSTFVNALSVTFGKSTNLLGFPGGLVQYKGLFYAGGNSNGYETRIRKNSGSQDNLIMKIEFYDSLNEWQNACLMSKVVSTSQISSTVT